MFNYRAARAVLYAALASAFVVFPASLSVAEEQPEPKPYSPT